MEFIECPDCGGWGEYMVEVGIKGYNDPCCREEMHQCETCNGDGEIENPDWEGD